MKTSSLSRLALGAALSLPGMVQALNASDADTVLNSFNKVFLNENSTDAFYQVTPANKKPDGGWSGSTDIFVPEDAYLRTGDPAQKTLVNKLCNTWLKHNPPPWHKDGWNDDIGWFTMALVRGYQITGTQHFLDVAKTGFDYAFGRGWNTTYNDGGIWEQNPEYIHDGRVVGKEALSTNSLGKVACLIYQSTHDQHYLDRCVQIFDWSHSHLFDNKTGAVWTRVLRNGTVDYAKAAYNQGTFLDYAHLLYKITGAQRYFDTAKLALDFGRANITHHGVFSDTAPWRATWADEFSRGAGSFIRDHNLWAEYYPFLAANAEGILANRRADLGITWNAWDKPTPKNDTWIANKFSSAAAWMQWVPAAQPRAGDLATRVQGIRTIRNNRTGLAVDSGNLWGNGHGVAQSNATGKQDTRWLITQNAGDKSWNIVNMATWQALQSTNGTQPKADNMTLVQWLPTREPAQRWLIDEQADGTFKIWNKNTSLALDGDTAHGTRVLQNEWHGWDCQRWHLE